jgi:hypothetical protein
MRQLASSIELKAFQDWLEDSSNNASSNLITHLDNLRPSVYLALERISNWYGVSSEVKLLKNDLCGWHDLQISYEYLKWSRSLRLAFLDANIGQKSGCLSEFTLPLAHALSIHDDDFAVFLGDRLVKAINHSDKRITFSNNDALHLYIIELYSRWRKLDIVNDKARTQSPLYQQLLLSCPNADNLAKIIPELCDYHLDRNEANDDIVEFWKAPYRFFPVELLAYDRIRMLDGFPSCLHGHVLLDSIFACPPKYATQPKDDILEQIIAKARAMKLI